VILFDSKYWKGFLDWLHSQTLAREFVSEKDFDLLRVCETTDEVVDTVQQWFIKHQIIGRRAVAPTGLE
jgi:predicted Rossmann-fold nucleotide-binding protein